MKLLVVSYVLPPHLYPQAIQVGRLLRTLPAQIVAVCGRMHTQATGLDCYPDFDSYLGARVEVPFTPALRGLAFRVAYHGLPLYAKIPDEFRRWVQPATRAALDYVAQAKFDADAIVSFGQPMSDHLVGLQLQRQLRLPWIAHFSDPWTDNPFRKWGPVASAINARQEAQVIEHADRIVFTSEETVDLVMRKYPAAWRSKARVLPHGYEPSLYGESQQPDSAPLKVRHLGSFYGPRSPLPLCRALLQMQRAAPQALAGVAFEMIGSTPQRFVCAAAWRSLPPGLLQVLPNVAYTRSLELMRTADLLLVVDAPAKLSVFLPSKLVDYIGAGQPVFGIVPPGASARLIARLGGEVADPRDVAGIAAGMRRALAVARERRAARSANAWGDPAVREEYLAERVSGRLHEIISEVSK